MKSAVISIWIPKQGPVEQGKACLIEGKKYFVANMTPNKEWGKTGTLPKGYSIARRILEALERGTTIVYKRSDLNQIYITNKTTFLKKGILLAYGGHSQLLLPLIHWQVKAGKFENEPKNLPVVDLQDWLKPEGKLVDMFSRREEIMRRIYA